MDRDFNEGEAGTDRVHRGMEHEKQEWAVQMQTKIVGIKPLSNLFLVLILSLTNMRDINLFLNSSTL